MRMTNLAVVMLVLLLGPELADAQKRIVLSYDDAPMSDAGLYTGEARTQALIDALDRAQAGPVVFFATTRGVASAGSGGLRLQAYAEAGHLLANHTHTHPWAHETELESYLADIDQAAEILSGFPNTRPWFRFPFLDEGRRPDHIAALSAGLQARGLSNGYVTVDTYDWHMESRFQQALNAGQEIDYDALGRLYVRLSVEAAEHYEAIARETLGHSPVHVLLLHENDLAARFAEALVQGLRDTGWEIVHPDQAYTSPLPEPRTGLTGQGRIAALAIDQGYRVEETLHWSISAAAIDAALAQSGALAAEAEPAGSSD